MPKEQKTRAQMDARFLWKLEDIYPTDQAWEEDFQKAKPAAAKGQYIRSATVASTMGPGIKLNSAKFGG